MMFYRLENESNHSTPYIAHTRSGPPSDINSLPPTVGVACNCEPFNWARPLGKHCGTWPNNLPCWYYGVEASGPLVFGISYVVSGPGMKSERSCQSLPPQKYVPRLSFWRHRSFDIRAVSSPLNFPFATGDPLVFVL